MQFFYWLIFLIIIGIAIFAIQNSSASPITIKFLFWQFETSLIYTILGSIILGVLITLFFWIPTAIKSAFHKRQLKREVGNLKSALEKSGDPNYGEKIQK